MGEASFWTSSRRLLFEAVKLLIFAKLQRRHLLLKRYALFWKEYLLAGTTTECEDKRALGKSS